MIEEVLDDDEELLPPQYQIVHFTELDAHKDLVVEIDSWKNWFTSALISLLCHWLIQGLQCFCLNLLAIVLHGKPPRKINSTNGLVTIQKVYVIDQKLVFTLHFKYTNCFGLIKLLCDVVHQLLQFQLCGLN